MPPRLCSSVAVVAPRTKPPSKCVQMEGTSVRRAKEELRMLASAYALLNGVTCEEDSGKSIRRAIRDIMATKIARIWTWRHEAFYDWGLLRQELRSFFYNSAYLDWSEATSLTSQIMTVYGRDWEAQPLRMREAQPARDPLLDRDQHEARAEPQSDQDQQACQGFEQNGATDNHDALPGYNVVAADISRAEVDAWQSSAASTESEFSASASASQVSFQAVSLQYTLSPQASPSAGRSREATFEVSESHGVPWQARGAVQNYPAVEPSAASQGKSFTQVSESASHGTMSETASWQAGGAGHPMAQGPGADAGNPAEAPWPSAMWGAPWQAPPPFVGVGATQPVVLLQAAPPFVVGAPQPVVLLQAAPPFVGPSPSVKSSDHGSIQPDCEYEQGPIVAADVTHCMCTSLPSSCAGLPCAGH
ncbi:unnamed protein product [Symbiodinium sp. CCMP2592]|nr:unnamed protein product [Symbiodinium sp. CCMP2592]